MIILCTTKGIDWTMVGAIGTVIAAIITGIYTYYTYQLLSENKKVTETNNKLAEFQIYNEIAKKLYVEQTWSYVEKMKLNTLTIADANSIEFRTCTLDPLEDLAIFYDRKLIDIDAINSGFGDIILLIGNNVVVKNFINTKREISKDYYSGFDTLFNDIKNK